MNFETRIKFLKCPASGQSLHKPSTDLLKAIEARRAAGELFRKKGQMVEQKVDEGLIAEDNKTLYPFIDGIPQLLAPEGISLENDSISNIDISDLKYREPYAEMSSYDEISGHHVQSGDEESALGGVISSWSEIDNNDKVTFPEPAELWLDAKGCLLAQEMAYKHLMPISGCRVLQLGGHGSHLIKFLMAGAREAWLVSPMINELKRARFLALEFGFEDRLFVVQGIAEELPVEDDFFDRIYMGGCLHHTQIEMTAPEIHRVLTKGGKASFVDPIMTTPYRLFVKPFYSRGIGRVDHAECTPIRREKAFDFIKHFHHGQLTGYRAFVHFPLIMATRYLKLNLSISLLRQIEEMDRAIGNVFPFLQEALSPISCLCVQK